MNIGFLVGVTECGPPLALPSIGAIVDAFGTIELIYADSLTGDLTYTVTSTQWAQTDPARSGPGVFTVTSAQDTAIQAGTPLVLIDVSISDADGDPQLDDTATLAPPLVLFNAAHTAPTISYAWQLDGTATGETGTSDIMDAAGDWRVVATVAATDAGGSAATSTSNVLTVAVASTAAINSITATPAGLVINYDGTLGATANPAGFVLEAT